MKRFIVTSLVLLGISGTVMAQEPKADVEAIAETIAASIEGYVKDFNAANVNGIVARWSDQGRITDADGNITAGREKLAEEMAGYFAKVEGATLSVVVESIELLSPSVARESGVATISIPAGQPERTDYVAIHIKSSDGWLLDSIDEKPHVDQAPSNYERLKDLDWMIGTWKTGSEMSSITTTCRWSKNQNFLIRSFAVNNEGEDDFEGTQVVGWDPINRWVRSWTFDSDGGYAAGRWTVEDGRFIENSKSILPDGRVGSSTHIYRLEEGGSVWYQAIARQVGDELLPSIGPVTVTPTP